MTDFWGVKSVHMRACVHARMRARARSGFPRKSPSYASSGSQAAVITGARDDGPPLKVRHESVIRWTRALRSGTRAKAGSNS